MNKAMKTLSVVLVVLILAMGSMAAYTNVTSRITPLSNSVGNNAPNEKVRDLPATFGMVDERLYSISVGSGNVWNHITEYTFNLPSNAYVNIDTRASIVGVSSSGLEIGIDEPNPCKGDKATMVLYEHPEMILNGVEFGTKNIPMQTNRVYYLTKGQHTIHVDVFAWMDGVQYPATVSPVTVSITATSKGNFQIKR